MMCFLLFSFLLCFVFSETVVEQVHIFSRYCDRTPFTDLQIPGNPVNWKSQVGEVPDGRLTSLGMNQCFKLGEIIRRRYFNESSPNHIKGLNLEYNMNDYYFRSSYYPRDSSSLNSIVQGLFPIHSSVSPKFVDPNPPHKKMFDALPNGTTVVPIHSMQVDQDLVLESLVNCPQYEEDLGDYYNSDEWKSYQREKQEDMDKILLDLGFEDAYNLEFFQWIYDTVWSMKKHNLFTSKNLTHETFENLKKLTNFVTRKIYSRKLAGVRGGGKLVEEIYNQMKGYVDQSDRRKFLYYLGDSTTFVSLFTALLLMDDNPTLFGQYPEDGATIAFELRRDVLTNKYFLNLVYLSAYDYIHFRNIRLLSLGGIGCEQLCPWKDYEVIAKQAFASNWCDLCNNEDSAPCMKEKIDSLKYHNVVFWVLIGVIFAIILVLILVFPFMICCDYLGKRKKFKMS